MNAPVIRPARRADAEPLGTLWLALLREQATFDVRFDVAEDALSRWRNDLPFWLEDEGRWICVAEREGRLIGFVAAQLWLPPPIYAASCEVYIDEVYVVPDARGQGVGQQLVVAAKAWASELGAVRVRFAVLAANTEARTFWERQQAQPFAVTYTIEVEHTAVSEAPVKKARFGF